MSGRKRKKNLLFFFLGRKDQFTKNLPGVL
jgi:hypothetical protein